MKKILIKWVRIDNFKGQRSIFIDFDDESTSLLGANETYKTTTYDAWRWIIDNKNSDDQAEFSIKNTRIPELNATDHIVEVMITVDGVENTFKKVLQENWVRKTGKLEKEKDGNIIQWWHNDFNIGKTAYMKVISDIIDPNALKNLTNTTFFPKMHWTDKRKVLFEMAGNPSNEDVAGTNPRFKALLEDLKTKTLDQLKKDKALKKNELKKKVAELPAQIKELTRSLPEEGDILKLRADIEAKKAELQAIENAITDRGTAYNIKNNANVDRANEIHTLEMTISDIKYRIRHNQQNKENDARIKLRDLSNSVQSVEQDLKSKLILKSSTEDKIVRLKNDKSEKLKSYHDLNATVMPDIQPGECICPTCKQDLPVENIEEKKKELVKNFNNDKAKKIEVLIAEGLSFNKQIEESEALIITLENQITGLEAKLKEAKEEEAKRTRTRL